MNKKEFRELVIPTTEKERRYQADPDRSLDYYRSHKSTTRWENGVFVMPAPITSAYARTPPSSAASPSTNRPGFRWCRRTGMTISR